MAIIYTYPVKTVPSLQDSIVITDEADNKKTKITGIGAIIALITGDFCTTSMAKINPDVGDIVSAVDCATVINFTSSDASVTITGNNATKSIDFKSAGGGGGSCPPTYVMRRVSCEEGDCFLGEKPYEWIYTCDETLGALAPGYINNLTLNGVVIEDCWYIELATYSASDTTCEVCCPETSYALTPCFSGTVYYTTETLTPGIAALAFPGSVSLITTPAGELCYQVSIASGDPPIAVVLGAIPEFGCESPECVPPTGTFSYQQCEDPSVFVTVDIDPGHFIGQSFSYCCESPGPEQYAICWEYKGDIGEPVGGTFDPCVNTATFDNCDCCINQCNYTYTACSGSPAGFPPSITFNMGFDGAFTCICNDPQPDIIVTNDSIGTTWCYSGPELQCLPITEGYTLSDVPENPCDDPEACPGVPATYTWQDCSGVLPLVTSDIEPGAPLGQIDRYCCGEEEKTQHCFEYVGNIGEPVGGSFPCEEVADNYPTDCMCCTFPCTYEYQACPGYDEGIFPPTIFVEVPWDETGCECQTPDPDVYWASGEDTWCYNTPNKVCLPPINTITGIAVCGDEVYCPTPEVDLRWKICSEGVESWRYEDELDPIPAPFNVPGNHYIGEIDTPGTCINGDCCIEVEETISLGPAVAWNTFIVETSCDSAYNATWEDCNCCINYDVVEYIACAVDPVCEIEGVSYPTLYVDVCLWGDYMGESWKPSSAPQFMTLSPFGEECCYEKNEVPPCVPETLISTHGFTYDDIGYGNPAWIDCTCTDIVFFQYRECGAEEWIDTDTNLEEFNNGGAWGDGVFLDVCYEIQEGGSGGLEIIPEDLFVTEYFGVGELNPCDCCEQDLRQYNICDGAAGATCNALAPATLYIDVSGVIGWDPATYGVIVGEEISSSIQCCYTLSEELPPCDAPTGTIISTAENCEDVACNLL